MKTKQLLCLLVLAVNGNTLGSAPMPGTQTPINVTEMANQHFAPLMQGMSMQNPIMIQMTDMDTKCMVHPDVAKKHILSLQDAYQEGVKAGCMAVGTHMQAAMTAMGNVVNKVPKK